MQTAIIFVGFVIAMGVIVVVLLINKSIGFEIRRFPATRVIGKQVICGLGEGSENPGSALWESMLNDGSLEFLMNLPQRATPDRVSVGWIGEYDPA
jgi:hypothetical protein